MAGDKALSGPEYARAGSGPRPGTEEAPGAPDPGEKMGVALVGLGQYSAYQLAPALQETSRAYLAGIVTGTPSKARAWKEKYAIPEQNIYDYGNFDEIVDNADIHIVYVALPNSMHAEFTIRAARAGKHVICEKPMATTVADAEKMLETCKRHGVQLAIGYRLHFEPFHQRVMELGQQQVYGRVLHIKAANSSDATQGSPDSWRLSRMLSGGGSLMDLGIYCIQGACYTAGKDPLALRAAFGPVTCPEVFHDVEQSVRWQMEFEDGLVADCHSSYAENEDELSAEAEQGWWRLSPAYEYTGKQGITHEGKMAYPETFEQVKQIDSQAESFRNHRPSVVPGEMGLRDMRILAAIYASAQAGGKRVLLSL